MKYLLSLFLCLSACNSDSTESGESMASAPQFANQSQSPLNFQIYWLRVVSYGPNATIKFEDGQDIPVRGFNSYDGGCKGWSAITLTGEIEIEYSSDPDAIFPGTCGPYQDEFKRESFSISPNELTLVAGQNAHLGFINPSDSGIDVLILSVVASAVIASPNTISFRIGYGDATSPNLDEVDAVSLDTGEVVDRPLNLQQGTKAGNLASPIEHVFLNSSQSSWSFGQSLTNRQIIATVPPNKSFWVESDAPTNCYLSLVFSTVLHTD